MKVKFETVLSLRVLVHADVQGAAITLLAVKSQRGDGADILPDALEAIDEDVLIDEVREYAAKKAKP